MKTNKLDFPYHCHFLNNFYNSFSECNCKNWSLLKLQSCLRVFKQQLGTTTQGAGWRAVLW